MQAGRVLQFYFINNFGPIIVHWPLFFCAKIMCHLLNASSQKNFSFSSSAKVYTIVDEIDPYWSQFHHNFFCQFHFCQKITNSNCEYKKAARKMLMKSTHAVRPLCSKPSSSKLFTKEISANTKGKKLRSRDRLFQNKGALPHPVSACIYRIALRFLLLTLVRWCLWKKVITSKTHAEPGCGNLA